MGRAVNFRSSENLSVLLDLLEQLKLLKGLVTHSLSQPKELCFDGCEEVFVLVERDFFHFFLCSLDVRLRRLLEEAAPARAVSSLAPSLEPHTVFAPNHLSLLRRWQMFGGPLSDFGSVTSARI